MLTIEIRCLGPIVVANKYRINLLITFLFDDSQISVLKLHWPSGLIIKYILPSLKLEF